MISNSSKEKKDISQIKVLHVAECVGGVERYLKCLLKYSKCENILVLSQLYNKSDFEDVSNNIEIMSINHGIGFEALNEARILRKTIKKYNPDIVYAHSSIAGAVARLACIGLKLKVIYNPHGWSFNMESGKRNLFISLERILSHFCDLIVCISEAEKITAIKKRICDSKKLRVIYNGIDISGYNVTDATVPIPNDKIIIGMVGRICKQKAPDIFVRMAEIVHRNVENTCFVIVGDVIEGKIDERIEIEKLAKDMGIDLIITGWVSNPQDYVRRFDVGCLLSRWEGFGLAIPEYMIAGVPVVASRVDAIPFLINDGVDGLLVEKDNWQDAASKVLSILNDDILCKGLVDNAHLSVVNKFDAQRVAKEFDKLYKEIV